MPLIPPIRRRLLVSAIALATTFIVLTPPAHSTPGPAFVRVNQVGYPAASAKRAYLMSTDAATNGTFEVKDGTGVAVFSGPIGPLLGSWSRTFPFVYALDFGSVTAPGTYSIAVSGPVSASSPTFEIDTGQNVYDEALANALSFFQTERDGPDFIAGPLRSAPAHLNDQNAMTYLAPHVNPSGRFSGDLDPLGVRIDASGGWWDAGDHIKGVQTLSYTTDMLLTGVRDFPALMGAARDVGLHGGGEVRDGLAPSNVGRRDEDLLFPGGDRNWKCQCRRGPRHLAPAPGG
jgi:endoglucanase